MSSNRLLSAQVFAPIHEKLERNGFSGVVLVQQGDRPLLQQATGFSHRSWQIPNQINTRFRIASISKMFTAVAILQLIEKQHFTLDTPVMPRLGMTQTAISNVVSIYHLLTMTAGIADWFDESGDWENDWTTFCRKHSIHTLRQNQDYLPLFIHKPMVNRPGLIHQYNNASYILLGCLIEQATGESYFNYIQHHIFAPAQMNASGFFALDDAEVAIAEGYVPIKNSSQICSSQAKPFTADSHLKWKRNIYFVTPEPAADGGAISTVQDMQRFSSALRTGKLLSSHWTQAILAPKVLEDADNYRGYIWKYGFGNFFLIDGIQQVTRWGHTGEEEGVSCRFYHYPHYDIDVVILSNQSRASGALGWDIHDAIVGARA